MPDSKETSRYVEQQIDAENAVQNGKFCNKYQRSKKIMTNSQWNCLDDMSKKDQFVLN